MRPTVLAAGLVFATSLAGVYNARAQAPARTPAPAAKAPANPQANSQKSGAKNAAAPAPFVGQVVKVTTSGGASAGTVWVKHADGHIHSYQVNGSTKLTGVSAFGSLTKGSMVSVVGSKGNAASLAVSSLAPPPPRDAAAGSAVTGTVVKAHSDKYGDSGTLTVKTPKGDVQTYQVTNSTVVQHPKHKDFVHSFQFVVSGDTVSVEHDGGKVALLIQVTATK